MFHKPRFFKLYFPMFFAIILRLLSVCISFYFSSMLYSSYINGVVDARHGRVFTLESEPFSYWLRMIYYLSLALFFMYLTFAIRSKNGADTQ